MISAQEHEAANVRGAAAARAWRAFEPKRDHATRQSLAVIALLFVCQAIPLLLVLLLGTGCVRCHWQIQSDEYLAFFRECMTHVPASVGGAGSECNYRASNLGLVREVCE